MIYMLLFYFPILHEENECILIVYMIFILTYELYSTNDVLHLNVLYFWMRIFSQIYKILV